MTDTKEITETLRKINEYAKSTDSELVRRIIRKDIDKLRERLKVVLFQERVRKIHETNWRLSKN